MVSIMQQRGFENPAVLEFWERAVGDSVMAQHCFPVKITKQQQSAHKTLVVKVHPAYSTIFAHQSEAILQRLTVLIGRRPAGRIVIVQ